MMKHFRKSCAVLLGAWLLTLLLGVRSNGLTAPSAETRESNYTVHAKGLKVGELRSVCSLVPRNEKKALKYEATTRIHADFLVYSYKLDSQEEALVAEEGTVRYRRTSRENDNLCQVEGRLDHGRFLLDIRENGVSRTRSVGREQYDYTTMECPEVTLKREGDEMALRLLDLETLTVVTRRYRWVKSEDLVVDGKRIHCRVVDFEDPNKKCRRWISPDELGAVIARQDGKGKGGSYSLRMAHMKNLPQT
jgi:hypothetical protein